MLAHFSTPQACRSLTLVFETMDRKSKSGGEDFGGQKNTSICEETCDETGNAKVRRLTAENVRLLAQVKELMAADDKKAEEEAKLHSQRLREIEEGVAKIEERVREGAATFKEASAEHVREAIAKIKEATAERAREIERRGEEERQAIEERTVCTRWNGATRSSDMRSMRWRNGRLTWPPTSS